jgi:hypothetical protein
VWERIGYREFTRYMRYVIRPGARTWE